MWRKFVAILIGAVAISLPLAGFDFSVLGLDSKVDVQVGTKIDIVSTTVQPRPLALACPGSAFVETSKSGVTAKFHHFGTSQIALNRSGESGFETSTTPTTVTADDDSASTQQGSDLLSANQTQILRAAPNSTSAGANGMLSTECQLPGSDFWFIGGDTSVGRQSLLVVQNPSKVDATLNLELFDERGVIQSAGMQGLFVASGSTLVTPLAAFAPNNRGLTVHLSSQGGAVAAWIQQKTVRGTVAAGIDYVSSSIAPANQQVLPGLSIYGSKAATAIKKLNQDYSDLEPVVRVFVPGNGKAVDQEVDVTVLVSGIDAKTFGTVVRQKVMVGQSADIPIIGLADGTYSAVISAERPLFAALKLSRNSVDEARLLTEVGSDFTWISASDQITTSRTIVAPEIGRTVLNLVNASTTATSVTVVSGGVSKVYQLSQNALSAVSVKPGALIQISASSPVFANLTTVEDTGISNLRLLDAKNLGGEVSVTLR